MGKRRKRRKQRKHINEQNSQNTPRHGEGLPRNSGSLRIYEESLFAVVLFHCQFSRRCSSTSLEKTLPIQNGTFVFLMEIWRSSIKKRHGVPEFPTAYPIYYDLLLILTAFFWSYFTFVAWFSRKNAYHQQLITTHHERTEHSTRFTKASKHQKPVDFGWWLEIAVAQ